MQSYRGEKEDVEKMEHNTIAVMQKTGALFYLEVYT